MTSLRDIIHVLISVLLLLLAVEGATTRKKTKDSDDVWLSDLIDYDYLGDAPDAGSDFCPPVPSVLPSGSCTQTPCNSDRACAHISGKCCYNGCIYTCLYQVGIPGFFDWSKEPRRRLSSGRSWLVDSPDTVIEAEPCSTTPVEADEDPLLCPHGYVCSIDDQGNSRKGIPNRGRCVMENNENEDNADLSTARPPVLPPRIQRQMRKERVCEEENGFLILEGATVMRKGRQCKCRRGKLVCPRRRQLRTTRKPITQRTEEV
ncbi:WAP four-disulfide core domain protein 1-like [Haliotis rufescens]|uniref:WAP four-disulfide core domain protein 1-like n=1 Tax=Haliotis rufescens TaxID=6454 RepID=UPI00201EF51A|nr:WAP four-disulfide core domain protein 1-like [Haliotis rufescens]XP_048258728.1 WAP four-disulfide core domain protein 1-like [Haliotis rufescens]XP_048258729.1 WAP four-disulfide core domain protein 1-like [Haliotis rufescens]